MNRFISAIFYFRSFDCRYQSVCSGGGSEKCFNKGLDFCTLYLDDRCSACSKSAICEKKEARRFRRGRNRG